MSLEIIIQEIKLFGNLIVGQNKTNNNNLKVKQQQQSISSHNDNISDYQQQQRKFRLSLGHQTHTSTNTGFFITPNQLIFDQPLTLYYDNKSLHSSIQIFSPLHQQFTITDIQSTLFADIDLTDISTIINDRIQTTLFDINDKAVGKLTALIEVFRQGPRFIEKVSSNVLFETVKEEKLKQIQASQASKNIKQLMVTNSLTNTLMTINYLQLKPHKEDTQIFNRQTFILIRYGFTTKAYSKLYKVQSKQSIIFNQYLQFMKNDDTKFEFFFMFYDDLGNMICKAKGQIKYIVFDQAINNHTIVMFDKRSQIYGDLLVKFIQKQVQLVNNINNKPQKRLQQQQQRISLAIDQFNRFKFESKNNNRILSQKLRQLQLKQLEQQQQKMKPIDAQQIKKREEHSRFIQFLQREVIKIERELKKKQIQEKKGERKEKYYHHLNQQNHQQNLINSSNNNNANNNGTQKGGKYMEKEQQIL